MNLRELLLKNRSYRGFDSNHKIEREILESFIENTRFVPSSINLQPFKFFISNSEETNSKIFPLLGWAKKLSVSLPHKGEEPTAYIVICFDTDIFENEEVFKRDVGIVAQTVMLSAVEKGLGGCMIGSFSSSMLAKTLCLSENLKPQLVLALGKPIDKVIIETEKDGNVDYYRDDNDVQHVPKRKLENIIL